MDVRFAIGLKETQSMNTDELRGQYLVEKLMQNDKISLTYSHHDRVIVGGVKPVSKAVTLSSTLEVRVW